MQTFSAGGRVPNPRYPGSAARMSDGRLFTDYRPSSKQLGAPSLATKQRLQATGEQQIRADRSILTMMAGTIGVGAGLDDTMVPEKSKRICEWDGCRVIPAQEMVGIGQGRIYYPGRAELAAADPDYAAAEAGGNVMHAAFPIRSPPVSIVGDIGCIGVPATANRYSAPYGW